ncbi:tRNA glutamyl-Q(34) synthetase GluQRS [Lichenihabitans sp. PAMC28606]|uniref:tRNA glutamyl-Q(34) synthetase GluQRS n=1 Tax=Lichenihabitans sp. PAMC28606 TaxID=2880932 RepID=UPI001D0B886A|nr:tRNA glutamyl-Q(34) synthetase GluQRS [Lichenihabitans sp. PAMC28606]UDL93312.1 tRNA glutamyl-Q(34) synthetase GluQRS [Lichenihabitans sp. PAMC28606]
MIMPRMTIPSRPLVRFAPSPNGFLHLGHAYSALLNARLAAASSGDILLRMEDLDTERCTPAFATAIETDLAWLGLVWTQPVRHQSRHLPIYEAALDRLAARDLLYPCFCSRGDIAGAIEGRTGWPLDPDGSPLYPGTCRHLDAAKVARRRADQQPFCLRLDGAAAREAVRDDLGWTEYREGSVPFVHVAAPELWGDAVLRRKAIPASYHLAVVVDDALQGITDVIRGEDLLEATGLHRLLQELLGLPAPSYRHHALVRDAEGHKLSKSRGSPSLRDLRQMGASPTDLIETLGLSI